VSTTHAPGPHPCPNPHPHAHTHVLKPTPSHPPWSPPAAVPGGAQVGHRVHAGAGEEHPEYIMSSKSGRHLCGVGLRGGRATPCRPSAGPTLNNPKPVPSIPPSRRSASTSTSRRSACGCRGTGGTTRTSTPGSTRSSRRSRTDTVRTGRYGGGPTGAHQSYACRPAPCPPAPGPSWSPAPVLIYYYIIDDPK
jgi:hypothetical protein